MKDENGAKTDDGLPPRRTESPGLGTLWIRDHDHLLTWPQWLVKRLLEWSVLLGGLLLGVFVLSYVLGAATDYLHQQAGGQPIIYWAWDGIVARWHAFWAADDDWTTWQSAVFFLVFWIALGVWSKR